MVATQRTGAKADPNVCLTMSVPEAGKTYFDLSRNGSYAAVRRGEIPVVQIGRKLRVPVSRLEKMLNEGK